MTAAARTGRAEDARRGALGWHAAWALGFLAIALPTLGFLWRHWTSSVWHNGHGIAVPFCVAYLVAWSARHRPVRDDAPTALGLVPVAAGLSLVLLDTALASDLLAAVGLLLCLPGFVLLLLGPGHARAWLVPWLVTFLMLPIPQGFLGRLHWGLRRISTEASAFVLERIGVPHHAVGTRIELVVGNVEVVDACSGFSALYAAVTIALVLAFRAASWRRRALLLGLAAPLAIGFNVLRVLGMVLIAELHGFAFHESWAHEAFGWVTFSGALLVLLWIARRERAPA